MDDLEQLQEDLRQGRIDPQRFVEVLLILQRQLQTTQAELQAARQRIEELEQQLGGSPTAKLDQPFSLKAEEQRQHTQGKQKPKRRQPSKRRGRLSTLEKIGRAERSEDVFPDEVDPNQCKLSHTRVAWRLEQGRAVLVAYRIYRGPNNRYGKIPGVLGKSEFGMEILLEIAYLVYVVGLSFDKVCLLLHFFQNLHLSKSQADSLLTRLSRHWEKEFDSLCTLLAHSLVVHADETSWSIHSVWAFLSEKARVLLYGVPKDAATLEAILDPETFAGLVISDDAAVYANFSQSQKCWAHLVRKAIKLTLQAPDHEEYRHFTDRLLEIYRDACRVQRDGRFSERGRLWKVSKLEEALIDLCSPHWNMEKAEQEGPQEDYRRLVNELMRLVLAEQLFGFVTAQAVEQPNGTIQRVSGTNNEAERTLRGVAQARKTDRGSKTRVGARRQTILSSVLESLRLYLAGFTLRGVLEEMTRWQEEGRSCFTKLMDRLELSSGPISVLDKVLPLPDG